METIRLRGPGDVLACLPYQLGYQPRDSVVVVALEDRRVGLVQRLDLPPPDEVDEAARVLVEALCRHDVRSALLVGYEEVRHAARPLLDEVADLMEQAGVEVVDRLGVHDGRWYALDCDEPCCPSQGTPLPLPADVPAVAEFVALGAAPLATRGALGTLVAVEESVAGQVGAALRRQRPGDAAVPTSSSQQRRAALAVWREALDLSGEGRPVESTTPAQVAQLVTSLADVPLRDGLIAWLCPGTLPLDDVGAGLMDAVRAVLPVPAWADGEPGAAGLLAGRRLLVRLQWLARAVPDAEAAPLLTVLANVAWWFGDGAQARVALDRALEHTPDYTLARLVTQMVDLGVRPGGPWSGRRRRGDRRLV